MGKKVKISKKEHKKTMERTGHLLNVASALKTSVDNQSQMVLQYQKSMQVMLSRIVDLEQKVDILERQMLSVETTVEELEKKKKKKGEQ